MVMHILVDMTGFSRETVLIHLKKSYSIRQLTGNILVAVGLLAFVLAFPTAFDVISYPAWIALFIVFGSTVAYSASYAWVHAQLNGGTDPLELIRKEQLAFYIRSVLVMVLVPSFGERYAHLLWFVPALVAAGIFSSAYIPSRLKRLACYTPLLSLFVHYLYWNLPPTLSGEPGFLPGKQFQIVEVGFMVLLIGLISQTRTSLENNTRLATNITLDQGIVEGFIKTCGLSDRESEILYKVLQGASTKEISDSLFISSGTVRNHLSHIFQKTGTHSRMELAAQVYVGSASG
jgi:DNA-binding CsgD family transcriptional regulator